MLGFDLHFKFNWTVHINNVCKKISRGSFLFWKLSDCVSSDFLRTHYFGLVQSHFAYGLILWGRSSCKPCVKTLSFQLIELSPPAVLQTQVSSRCGSDWEENLLENQAGECDGWSNGKLENLKSLVLMIISQLFPKKYTFQFSSSHLIISLSRNILLFFKIQGSLQRYNYEDIQKVQIQPFEDLWSFGVGASF